MALFKKKQRADPEAEKLKSFLDMIAPSLVKFEFDRYFCGNSIRCVWALREYPASTESQAILRHLGEKSGVTLRIYCRQVSPGEEAQRCRRTAYARFCPLSFFFSHLPVIPPSL